MIRVEQLAVSDCNLVSVVKEPDVYGVKTSIFHEEKFAIEPIAKCEIGKLLSNEIAVIRITKVEA